MGNVDNVLVDLATGTVTRLTANLDYEKGHRHVAEPSNGSRSEARARTTH